MTEHSLGVMPFYKGWDGYQQHLVAAIAPLSAEQLELRAAPHLRSVSMLATHIIGVRAGWLYYVLHEGGAAFAAMGEPDHLKSAAELVSGLETSWQVIQDCLQRWTAADLEQTFVDTDDDGHEEIVTRQWVIWHLIEHDMHHGGELSFLLGMHGVPAINL